MKKLILFSLCFMICILPAIAGSENPDSTATVYLYRRPFFYGTGTQMKILINNEPVVRLKSRSVYRHEVDAGEVIISCKMFHLAQIMFNARPGETYYVECLLAPGFWSGIPVLELKQNEVGRSVVMGGSLRELEYKPIPTKERRFHAGPYALAGGGFERIEIGLTTDNKDITISTGGGMGLGAELGYQLNRYFDISLGLMYQSSMQNPYTDNTSAWFYRFGANLTPALVIPVRGGDFMRFRLGVGPGFYTGGTLEMNTTKIGGDEFTLKYKSTPGFHGSFIFETNVSDRSAFTLGLKYYNIQYTYTSTGSTGQSSDPKINSPDGSGIDFVFGYNFWF